MSMTQNRRQFLAASTSTLAATFAASLGLSGRARAADPLGIALILPSPVADVGWSHSLTLAMQAVQARLGEGLRLTLIENIPEGPDADRIMQKAVSDGNKFIMAGSFGYMNGALQLARRHPDVSILHASGYQTAPNMANFAARYYLGTYLMGMAAAAVSKTGRLGSVSAFAIPELITSINAFALGARAVNPQAEVTVVWVNSWFDPAKEQDAAKALLAQGCDVIFSNAQDTPSVISVCEAAGAYAFNLNSSMKAYGPNYYLGCVDTDWSPYFLAEVEAHLAGSFKGASHWLGTADGVVSVKDWNPAIPAGAMARINDVAAGFAAGTLNPFSGPILRADGAELVKAGEVLSDELILSMDYHVQGVASPLPK
jgi:basic membrane protein A